MEQEAKPEARQKERTVTNIKGFDRLCQNGLLTNSCYLVSGNAGTGKSLFALQFIFNGLKDGERGMFISFEEQIEDLKSDALKLGMDFKKYEESGEVKFVHYSPYEITDFDIQLVNDIKSIGSKRVVIDSSSAFTMALEYDFEVRKELYSLVNLLKKLNCVSFIITEIPGMSDHECGALSRFGVEEFVVDGVIKFYIANGQRFARIAKMRGTEHEKMPVQFRITNTGFEFLSKVSKAELRKK